MARRNGDDWWLGAITGWTPAIFELPLSFLGDGKYRATVYSDTKDAGDNPKHYEVKEMNVTSRSSINVEMVRGGGIAIKFTRLK